MVVESSRRWRAVPPRVPLLSSGPDKRIMARQGELTELAKSISKRTSLGGEIRLIKEPPPSPPPPVSE